jgi:hypothetical protein
MAETKNTKNIRTSKIDQENEITAKMQNPRLSKLIVKNFRCIGPKAATVNLNVKRALQIDKSIDVKQYIISYKVTINKNR